MLPRAYRRALSRPQEPLRKIRCQKRLADPPDRSRVQHRLDPVQDQLLFDTGQSGNLAERFTHKSLDPVFRHSKDLGINGIGVLGGNHLRRKLAQNTADSKGSEPSAVENRYCLKRHQNDDGGPMASVARGGFGSSRLFLYCFLACLVGPDANRFFDGVNEDFSIADLAGFGGLYDCCRGVFHHAVAKDDLDFDLWQKVDGVFTSTINFRVAFLTTKPFDFCNRHSLDSEV